MTTNPLLVFDALPQFDLIDATHIEPAVTQVLESNQKRLVEILDTDEPHTWNSLMMPLDEMEDRLSKVWSTASHLNAVKNSPEIRDAYNKCQPLITAYYTMMGQNEALYRAISSLSERFDTLDLGASQRKILDDYLLDFKLSGVTLDEDKKQQFAALESRLSELSNKFSNNVLDSTMEWSYLVTDSDMLSGLPDTTLEATKAAAKRKECDGYLFSLDFPIYLSVMTNADSGSLRETLYQAFVTRASAKGPHDKKYDNTEIINEILSLRAQLAKLLGYEHYAAVSVARKMAKSPQTVDEFLADLVELALPSAKREFAELEAFAKKEFGIATLQAWDVAYYSEKLRKQSFDISQEELRPYFPVEQVKAGLFTVANKLYGIEVKEAPQICTWDEGVTAYDIYRDGDVIARFYFDLYTREGKRSGAWMAECRSRRRLADGTVQIPVAYLVCNFSVPTESTPSLLTHNEVTTLFHEFGHGLHHMLTSEEHLRSSGINGVAWDAVELPSQLMENWCWNRDAIALISSHYQSGEPLPADLLEKLLQAKNFQAGMKTVRQLEFALFDFEVHKAGLGFDSSFVREQMKRARELTNVFEAPEFNRFENSFSHIFAGGYAAGYYSYKWAEVLSADVFSKFANQGVFNAQVGSLFLESLLSRGGGADPLELFVNFMGREPELSALLKQDGLLPNN
ncbi:MAG: M3 family metallopeptidase [Pseudohongiellaceae bacterium]|nr:M3 family metallopeptidase [Pseudohongiellaceae bacterium]